MVDSDSSDYDVKSESDEGGVLGLTVVESEVAGSGITRELEGEGDKLVSQDSSEKISRGQQRENQPAVALPFRGIGTQGDAWPGDTGEILSSNNGAGYVGVVNGEGRRQKRRASVGVDYRGLVQIPDFVNLHCFPFRDSLKSNYSALDNRIKKT